ncbi:MAG: hypothetical protein Q4D93_03285 [Porphyromonas sp.]|nr:hypothetical protein [Porphyromonas sp.]
MSEFGTKLITRLSYIALLAMLALTACNDEKSGKKSEGSSEQGETTQETISLEEAEQMMHQQGSDKLAEQNSFVRYNESNAIFLDPEAPCNKGEEALQDFIVRFSEDKEFQEARCKVRLPEVEQPGIRKCTFTILEPDSTGFFASWLDVEADSASFCTGWLNSEMEQEFVFERLNDGLWYLTDYIGPMT